MSMDCSGATFAAMDRAGATDRTMIFKAYNYARKEGIFNGSFAGFIRTAKMNDLWRQQDEYENYWVRNAWGFGDKMRDYLLEGPRRIRFSY